MEARTFFHEETSPSIKERRFSIADLFGSAVCKPPFLQAQPLPLAVARFNRIPPKERFSSSERVCNFPWVASVTNAASDSKKDERRRFSAARSGRTGGNRSDGRFG